jgi:hypothetical protein
MDHAKARAEVGGILDVQSERLRILLSSSNTKPDVAHVIATAQAALADAKQDLELLVDNIYEDGC